MKTVQIDNKEQVENIISSCSICYVGLIDTDNTPYVIPMNFGYKDGVVYLHSAPDGHLVDCIYKNSKICITFNLGQELVFQHPKVACSYRMRSKSVVCKGKVNFIEDLQEKEEILNVIMAKYVPDKAFSYSEPALKNVKVWEIPLDKVSAKEFAAPHGKPKIIYGNSSVNIISDHSNK